MTCHFPNQGFVGGGGKDKTGPAIKAKCRLRYECRAPGPRDRQDREVGSQNKAAPGSAALFLALVHALTEPGYHASTVGRQDRSGLYSSIALKRFRDCGPRSFS